MASRYAAQSVIVVVQSDGSTRSLGVPRVAASTSASLYYVAREGDRLDLLGGAALADTTAWWRIGDSNPYADAFALERPGTTIAIPEA